MQDLWRQLSVAWRNLARRPVVTGAVILCLAFGIGPNTAVFSIVDSVLLRPLPYEEPEEVVVLWERFLHRGQPEVPFSMREFRDVDERTESFERLAAVGPQLLNITGEVDPERLLVARGTEGVFDLLGVDAAQGRLFTADDHEAGASTVAVLSDDLWRRRFGADESVLGRTVSLNGRPAEVVGVLPPGFRFGSLPYDLWLPAIDRPNPPPRTARFLTVVGRLADGVALEEARAELGVVADHIRRAHPELYPSGDGWSLVAVPALEDLVSEVDTMLLVLAIAVGLVLLVACANVANLLLAQAVARRKEVAIRGALGAGRGALIRQFLTESLFLSLAGAALGLLLARWVVDTVVRLSPDALPRSDEIGMDGRVLLFTLGVALLSSLLFGLAPALHGARFDLRSILHDGGKTSAAAGSGGRVRNLLVVAEVALALVVLIGASLVIKSFSQILATDPGYRAEKVLSLQLSLSRQKHPENHQAVAFFRNLTQRLETLPGVRRASVTSHLPATGYELAGEVIPEGWTESEDRGHPSTGWRMVGPGYFQAMGIPLRRGRVFEARDDAEGREVVVLDERLAERLWPGEDPLGKRLRIDAPREEALGWREVVGVVGNVRHDLTGPRVQDQLYIPYPQYPVRIMSVVARTEAAPEALIPQVRGVIGELDPDLPVEDVQPMDARVRESISQPRLTTVLFAAFAAVALVLAVVGVYGVIAYSTAQRSREIGLRITLGAHRLQVLGMVLRRGMLLTAAGLALGVLGALAMSRLLAGFLHGVSSTDAGVYLSVCALLAALGAVASYFPAHRAARTDPSEAFRSG